MAETREGVGVRGPSAVAPSMSPVCPWQDFGFYSPTSWEAIEEQ